MKYQINKEKLNELPTAPGCYIYRNKSGNVLYVGKGINIKNRVKSYFSSIDRLDPKIKKLINQVYSIETVTTDSNLEALILETNLIKKYKPKYNRLMKDDKNYSWLMVTKGEDFPRLEFIRNKKIKSADYFGPYVNLKPIKRALKELRKIFPYRSCRRKIYFYKDKNGKRKLYSSNRKVCLYYHLNLCEGPCDNLVTKKEYRDNINNIKRFFRSDKTKIIRSLKKDMRKYASKRKYEKAAKQRDKIEDLQYITQRIKVEEGIDEKLLKKEKRERNINALERLIRKLSLNFKGKLDNFKIECYDISNISGKSATGSMVVFVGGEKEKSLYRKFKIKTKDTPDDFKMLREVFDRRFSKTEKDKDESFQKLPDLIIVDGGKGQLSSVLKILKNKNLKIPVIGLAKREEEIFQQKREKFKKKKLRKRSDEYFLIQRIRDEAHRFAIRYHRKLHSKKMLTSKLDDIPGVGKVTKRKLLKAFGSYHRIKDATRKDLNTVIKNRKTVENILRLT